MRARSTFRVFVAVLLLLAVVVICLSPAVDLPETALRAKRDAQQIATTLVALALAVAALLLPLAARECVSYLGDERPPNLSLQNELLPLLC